MKLRLIKLRDTLADSFWFLPALMALLAAGAALGSVALDHALGSRWVDEMEWVWSGGADGARGVLSVVAGSVMTVVSIVFSLTVTTLAQTSSHFGPRVLRNFTSDRGVQFTLGTFIATFIYCLLVLRTVRSVDESSFVPYLSVNIGVLMALASLAVLIFFIHHVSRSIQGEHLIAEAGEEFQRTLPALFPERAGEARSGACTAAPQAPDESRWREAPAVKSSGTGYLQRVDGAALLRLAGEHDLILRLEKRPGDFVNGEAPLLRALCAQNGRPDMPEGVEGELRACFSLGRLRTPHQDALYTVQQLVEIAAHALSPGINEPFTALTCIDWLGAALRGVARRDPPEPLRRDEAGRLRVIAPALDFGEIAGAVFDQIRLYGAENPAALLRLLEIIGETAPVLKRAGDRDALIFHAKLIGADAGRITNITDRARVHTRLAETLGVLNGIHLNPNLNPA